ncbi:MAG TPA: fused MFS/spermidine synthase [Candidatus Aquicultor sp.]
MAKATTKDGSSKTKPSVKSIDVPMEGDAVALARRIAVFAFAFSGMAALIYEVVWTRELSLVFGSTVYAVSMMLTAFMSGLSLGGFLGGKWADKSKNLFALFGMLELGIGIFGILSIPLIQVLPTLYFFVFNTLKPSFYLFFVFQLLLSFVIMLIPTTFMGASFPVVTKAATLSLEEIGSDVGNVYSINTVGSIFGSLGAGFLLIPLIGIKATTMTAACLNLAVAIIMIMVARSGMAKRVLSSGIVIIIAITAVAVMVKPPAIAHNFYRIADYQTYDQYKEYLNEITTVYFSDDLYGRVTVFQSPDGARSLANDGKVEGSSTEYDKNVMSLFSLLPVACADNPKSVLVIGLGTGFTAYGAIYSSNAMVDIAEINRSVREASKFFVGNGIEGNPRAKFYVNDARNYLYTTTKTYDMVTSEPSYPVSTHISPLFTQEFFRLVAKHLNNDGIYCQWIPRYIMRDQDMLTMFKTFTSIFPNTYVWGMNYGSSQAQDVLMIGINGNKKLDVAAIDKKVRQLGATKLGLNNIDFGFYAYPDTLQKLVSGTLPDGSPIQLNTDDHPIMEYVLPKNHIDFFREGTKAFN